MQQSELRGQLAQFLLSTREPDGSSLLENPTQFSAAQRPLNIVTLRKTFFSYLLHTGNAKSFKTSEIDFEAPRACQIEFSGAERAGQLPTPLQACFAAVQGDPTGRYVYFSLRYPSEAISRHRSGQALSNASRVVLSFEGAKEARLTLAFQAPPLARSRYPSQMGRFEEVHELVGYASNDSGQASRMVNGQAFERTVEQDGKGPRNFVTLVGRVDSSLLISSVADIPWPSDAIRQLGIGVQVFEPNATSGEPFLAFDVPTGAVGKPLSSLTQAYLAAVPSRASLEVAVSAPGEGKILVWRSDDAGVMQPTTRLQGAWQAASDWWAELTFSAAALSNAPVSASQVIRVAGMPDLVATLTATPFTLPDIATRAFTWLSAASLVILLLAADWSVYIIKLSRLRRTAYSMVVRPRQTGDLQEFVAKNEIGTLARVFHLLIEKGRFRNASIVRLHRNEALRQAEELRLADAHVQNRKAILDAIGHEIRSPLQSLLNRTREDAEVQEKLRRIRRAVEALYEATSVDDGLKSGEIAIAPHNLASFLQRFARNLASDGKHVVYVGPMHEVKASVDTIVLEQILDNLIENADRYREDRTDIELRLQEHESGIELSVFNQGPPIPEADIERIFDLGVSDSTDLGSGGLGLFASRIYGLAMALTLHASNEPNGVSLTLRFPSN